MAANLGIQISKIMPEVAVKNHNYRSEVVQEAVLSAVTLHVVDDILLKILNIFHVDCSQEYFYPFPDFHFL